MVRDAPDDVARASRPRITGTRRRTWRRVGKHLLGVAAVAVCVFTALQVREFFLLRPTGSPPPGSRGAVGSLTSGPAGVDQAWSDDSPLGNPLELRHAAEQAGAMQPYAGAPAGLAPPVGASPLDGWQQHAYGATRRLRTYHCPQKLDDVAVHYRQTATDAGLSLMGDLPGPGTLRLLWTAPGLHVTVNLRQESNGHTRATVTASWQE